MNKNAMATATRQYLNEFGTTYVTGTILQNALDRAARKLNTDTEANRSDATISIAGGGREVSIPTTVLDVYRVRLGTGSQRVRLSPVSMAGLDRDNAGWEGGTYGTPTQYYFDGNIIGFDPLPRSRTAWATATLYALNEIVRPGTDNGFWYKCTTAGTSGATHPTWPTTLEGTVSDGNTAWEQAGCSRVYLRALVNVPGLTNGTTTPTWLPARYHDAIAKGAALDIAGGMDIDKSSNQGRLMTLYKQYQQEVAEIRRLAANRSREFVPRMTPTGYGTYRR